MGKLFTRRLPIVRHPVSEQVERIVRVAWSFQSISDLPSYRGEWGIVTLPALAAATYWHCATRQSAFLSGGDSIERFRELCQRSLFKDFSLATFGAMVSGLGSVTPVCLTPSAEQVLGLPMSERSLSSELATVLHDVSQTIEIEADLPLDVLPCIERVSLTEPLGRESSFEPKHAWSLVGPDRPELVPRRGCFPPETSRVFVATQSKARDGGRKAVSLIDLMLALLEDLVATEELPGALVPILESAQQLQRTWNTAYRGDQPSLERFMGVWYESSAIYSVEMGIAFAVLRCGRQVHRLDLLHGTIWAAVRLLKSEPGDLLDSFLTAIKYARTEYQPRIPYEAMLQILYGRKAMRMMVNGTTSPWVLSWQCTLEAIHNRSFLSLVPEEGLR